MNENLIVQFVRTFCKKCKFYYDHETGGVKFNADVDKFDNYGKTDESHRVFVERMAMARGDLFTSDREAVAFIRTLKEFGGQEAFANVTKQDWIDAVKQLNGIIPQEERIEYFNKMTA